MLQLNWSPVPVLTCSHHAAPPQSPLVTGGWVDCIQVLVNHCLHSTAPAYLSAIYCILKHQLTATTLLCDNLGTCWPSYPTYYHRRLYLCCCLEQPIGEGAVVHISTGVLVSPEVKLFRDSLVPTLSTWLSLVTVTWPWSFTTLCQQSDIHLLLLLLTYLLIYITGLQQLTSC